MAWCRQAASHYLSQCWPKPMSPYMVSLSQNEFKILLHTFKTMPEGYIYIDKWLVKKHSQFQPCAYFLGYILIFVVFYTYPLSGLNISHRPGQVKLHVGQADFGKAFFKIICIMIFIEKCKILENFWIHLTFALIVQDILKSIGQTCSLWSGPGNFCTLGIVWWKFF